MSDGIIIRGDGTLVAMRIRLFENEGAFQNPAAH